MSHTYVTCQLCKDRILHKKLFEHIKYQHGIPIQSYLNDLYGLKINFYIDIDLNTWEFMQSMYLKNRSEQDINEYFKQLFIDNQYDANNLVNILRQYTLAISQYFEFPLNNADQYPELLSLKCNDNNSRSKYRDILKSTQYKAKRINSRPKVKCDICGKEYLDTSILNHVYNAHGILRKQYLQNKFNLPDELNYDSLRYTVAQKMYEELQKSPYDNYHDCYKALFKQYGSYAKMSEALGYNVKYACEGLNIAEPQKWTDEQKDAQRQRKLGTKWTELQRQKIIEGKLKSGKYKQICGYMKEGLANENTSL